MLAPTHTLGGEKEVSFEMIGDNYTQTLGQLDSIRARKSKFVCVNDNMKNPTRELEVALKSFFESFFPFKSQFELPDGHVNPTLYIDEYRVMRSSGQWTWIQWRRRTFTWALHTLKQAIHLVRVAVGALTSSVNDLLSVLDGDSSNSRVDVVINDLHKEVYLSRATAAASRRSSGSIVDSRWGLPVLVLFLSSCCLLGLCCLQPAGRPEQGDTDNNGGGEGDDDSTYDYDRTVETRGAHSAVNVYDRERGRRDGRPPYRQHSWRSSVPSPRGLSTPGISLLVQPRVGLPSLRLGDDDEEEEAAEGAEYGALAQDSPLLRRDSFSDLTEDELMTGTAGASAGEGDGGRGGGVPSDPWRSTGNGYGADTREGLALRSGQELPAATLKGGLKRQQRYAMQP